MVQTRSAGDPYWRDFPVAELFRMEVFGHRTRLDRLLLRWGGRDPATRELAAWIAAEHARRHPDAAAIVAVRFLVGHVAIDEGTPPSGAWQPPPPGNRIGLRTIAEHVVP